jgi:hypothetical protein
MDCRLVGRWRIVEADLWDRDYLDLVAAATMTIGADGHGEIAYGAMQASLELEYHCSTVFFTGPASTKATKSPAPDPPNSTTMAPSRSHSPTTSATRPSSKPNEWLLQQPARRG